MINHCATLLANIDTAKISVELTNERLFTSEALPLLTNTEVSIDIDEMLSEVTVKKQRALYTNTMFSSMKLPQSLARVHEILFPKNASVYYHNFLLFCYLKILESAGLSAQLTVYDQRITYDLSKSPGYFNLTRISSPISSDPRFSLDIGGSLKASSNVNYYYNNFIVRQISNSSKVYIYSISDNLYYKYNEVPEKSSQNKQIDLIIPAGDFHNTNIVFIGDTGLMFRIHGPMNDFNMGGNKVWSFIAEAPFNFELAKLLDTLKSREYVVADMLNLEKEKCSEIYENYWSSHFNDIYRFAGLLMAYIERAHILWQRKAM
jgi:hypothetical protein